MRTTVGASLFAGSLQIRDISVTRGPGSEAKFNVEVRCKLATSGMAQLFWCIGALSRERSRWLVRQGRAGLLGWCNPALQVQST